jgi:uncharacterized protein YkwD
VLLVVARAGAAVAERVRRLLVPIVAAVAAALVPAGAAHAASCAGAHARPHHHNAAKVRRATLCLLNEQRAAAGLSRIRANHKLAKAAKRHSRDMVVHGYFDHSSPSGSTLLSRLTDVRYVTATISWYAAENIGWGSGRLATPRSIVHSWMHSPPHRANILSPQARDAGVGIALGAPGGGSGATYTLDFGRRG